MDVQELSTILEMQSKTQKLLQQLQNKQTASQGLMNSSEKFASKHQKHCKMYQSGCGDDKTARTPSDSASQIKVKKIHDALAGMSKLNSYRRVSPHGDKPGKRREFKLAQGIESSHRNDLFCDEKENQSVLDCSDHADLNSSVTFQDQVENQASRRTTKIRTDIPAYKSILKRRKMIDDNIKVQSKYSHTPSGSLTEKDFDQLNYSYGEDDDLEEDPSLQASLRDTSASYKDPIGQSWTDPHAGVDAMETRASSHGGTSDSKPLEADIHELVRERLLLDSGNDRRNASLVLDLSHRPKSRLFEPANTEHDHVGNSRGCSQQDQAGTQLRSKSSKKKMTSTSTKSAVLVKGAVPTPKLWQSRDEPLLGYDWIAGNLDNENSFFSLPDDYFHDINKFRSSNKEVCIGDERVRNRLDLARPISPEIQDPAHQCLHGFTVNDRLFTEAMNPDDDGKSVCPICLLSRPEPSQEIPGFVRVSIPRSTLEKPYKVKPHRRRSFDATDTYALSKHCLAGYECSLPTTIPTARNVDLKGANGIRGIQTMSLQEAENFVKSHSRTSRILSSTIRSDPGARDNGAGRSIAAGLNDTTSTLTTSLDPLSRKRTTGDLLNTSHSLRYDLQDIARRKGTDYHRAPHSTNYPTL